MNPAPTTEFRAKTSLEQLIDFELEAKDQPPLEEFARQRRANGESWPDLAFAIRSITGKTVTEQSLRRWFASVID